MNYTSGGDVLWPVPPDWADGVRETLEWKTDVLRARNARQQKRELRRAPRRFFAFRTLAEKQNRRVTDMLLQDRGIASWRLPIWHDVQLIAALSNGVNVIPCKTTGYEFAVAGQAVLWKSINEWEVVTINSITSTQLGIAGTTSRAWPLGTRLYPTRTAVLAGQPDEAGWTDASGTRQVQFRITEPCDVTGVLPGATYRGLPVLEARPHWGEDIGSVFSRDIDTIDPGTGVVYEQDFPGRAYRAADMRWICGTRAEHTSKRALLYALRGQMQSVWLPTWYADLVLTADIGASDTTITVEWAGYTLFGRMQPNWRDIRIELLSGTIYYRRVTAASESGTNEVLTLDAALGAAVPLAQVRVISFMVLSEQASDVVEIQHDTDAEGVSTIATRFRGLRNDI